MLQIMFINKKKTQKGSNTYNYNPLLTYIPQRILKQIPHNSVLLRSLNYLRNTLRHLQLTPIFLVEEFCVHLPSKKFIYFQNL